MLACPAEAGKRVVQRPSRSAQNGVHGMASEGVRAWTAQVLQDRRVLAPGVFESVGQERQLAPAAALVDDRGQLQRRTVIAGQAGGPEADRRTEGVAEDAP